MNREQLETIPQVHDLRFTGDLHHLIVASSGAGKFRDVLSNMLLYDGSCETACLIIDPKGEIAATVGPMTDAPGAPDPRTVILDPWDLCGTGITHALTLLDGIRADNPHCVKDARVLAEAIIIERGAEDGHWVATAKNFLAALLLYLGLDPLEENERNLFRLRQIVTTPWTELADLLGYMSDSTVFEGLMSRAAQAMLNRDEKERRAILSTLERDTAFVEDPGLWKAIKSSTFDINQLVLTNKRLHVIVPFDYTEQMSSWLRLTIAAFYNACLRNQLPRSLPQYLQFRHIIIDEFAGLGKLDFIMKGIAEARGAGIKYHLIVQNFAQLHNLYRDGWENLVSNSVIQAFGVNDNFTADYLSKMTGQSTVVTESKAYTDSTTTGTSTTKGSSSTSGHGGSSSGSSSSETKSTSTTVGSSVTFASTGRPVLTPDEIRRIPGDRQLLFLRQMPVLLTRRTPYYETFKRFLPRHSLRDVLKATSLIGRQGGLVPYDINSLRDDGNPLLEANSVLRLSNFSAPPYRPYTFWEALRQSPGFIAALVGLAGFIVWLARQEQYREARAVCAPLAQVSPIRSTDFIADAGQGVANSIAETGTVFGVIEPVGDRCHVHTCNYGGSTCFNGTVSLADIGTVAQAKAIVANRFQNKIEQITLAEFPQKLRDDLASRATSSHIGPTRYDEADFQAVVKSVEFCGQFTEQQLADLLSKAPKSDRSASDKYRQCYSNAPLPMPVSAHVEKPNRALGVTIKLGDPAKNRKLFVRVSFQRDPVEDAGIELKEKTVTSAVAEFFEVFGVGNYSISR